MKATSVLRLAALSIPLLLSAPAAAQEHCEGAPGDGFVKLTVQTVQTHNTQGQVAVTLYPDNPRRFLAPRGKLFRARVPVERPSTDVCYWVKPGVYAVAVYHDENRNGDFDRNKLGVPTEGFGFSNDAPTRFSVPSFDAVRFRVPPAGRTIRVKMRYPDAK